MPKMYRITAEQKAELEVARKENKGKNVERRLKALLLRARVKEDEAGFGRINKPKYCWRFKGLWPSVTCHHIREYWKCFKLFDVI